MELKQLTKKAHSSKVAVAATIALCAGWSTSALSAATTEIECDAIARDLRSLEIPAGTLSVSPVDHVSIEPDSPEVEILDAQAAFSESAAPFLFLTPRVASVLRDIFDVSPEVRDQQGPNEGSTSPVAESDRIPDISELLEQSVPSTATDNEVDLPLFQQRMFRTDI